MANTYKIWRDVSNSTLSNLQKILNAVTGSSKPNYNSYKQILTITSNWNNDEINNVFELFKSLTNSNGSNFTEVLNDIWDSSNSRFYTKTDTSLPFINIDSAKGRAMITTTTAEEKKINIVDDDGGYYLRIGSGIPFNPDYNLCYPQQDIVQALTKNCDNYLEDTINTGYLDKYAYAFENNNSDNICYVGDWFYKTNIPPMEWSCGYIFKPRISTYNCFASAKGGLYLKDNNVNYRTTVGVFYDLGIVVDRTKIITIFARFYLDSTIPMVAIYVDNEFKGNFETHEVTNGYRFFEANITNVGGYNSAENVMCSYIDKSGTITDDEALNWRGNPIKGTSEELLLVFTKQSDIAKVSNVNALNDSYTISGTILDAQWVTQPYYNYLENYGYGANKIPALADKTTCVDGSAITNPAIDGLNYGAEYYKQRAVYPALQAADINNKWYDVSGNIQEVTAFVSNFNDYSFANAKSILTYDGARSVEEITQITTCQTKENNDEILYEDDGVTPMTKDNGEVFTV